MQVLSSFDRTRPGTLVVDEDEIVEKQIVSGIAYSRDEAKITLRRRARPPGVAAAIFGAAGRANVNVDMIVQNVSARRRPTDMTFTVGKADLPRAPCERWTSAQAADRLRRGAAPTRTWPRSRSIGVGMRSHAGVAQHDVPALADKAINIQVISTREIKVSVLIAAEYTELAVRALHTAYGLDAA